MISFLKAYPPKLSRRIAVICGGNSAESEVSRISGQGVLDALNKNYKHVKKFELDGNLVGNLDRFNPEVVFPVLHGPPGEDGTFQGFLEILGYKYVGSQVHSSSFAMDKIIAKQIFMSKNLPVAKDIVIDSNKFNNQAISEILGVLGTDVVIKPARQGSALGVVLASNAQDIERGVIDAFSFDRRILIEQRIQGKEITVGVIETDQGVTAFPVIEVTTPKDKWYDFHHRYTLGLSQHIVPANLNCSQSKRLQDIAVKAHRALDCRDLSRADFIVPNDSSEYLLEVNTLPGMTPTSLYPDGAEAFGINFTELVTYFAERAANR